MPKTDTTKPWERPLIGARPFERQVWLCGRSDEAAMLSEIVGWAVGCDNEKRHTDEVAALKRRGYITVRRHRSLMGEWDAYALTASGFDRLAQIGYGDLHDSAVRRHRWYAERGSL